MCSFIYLCVWLSNYLCLCTFSFTFISLYMRIHMCILFNSLMESERGPCMVGFMIGNSSVTLQVQREPIKQIFWSKLLKDFYM